MTQASAAARLRWLSVAAALAALAVVGWPGRGPSVVRAAAFTPGNVVVYRVGSGSGALANTGSPVYLDEYTPAGTPVQSIALPTLPSGANQPLVASGPSTAE